MFIGILQVLRFDFQKFSILEILNFHPWSSYSFKVIGFPVNQIAWNDCDYEELELNKKNVASL